MAYCPGVEVATVCPGFRENLFRFGSFERSIPSRIMANPLRVISIDRESGEQAGNRKVPHSKRLNHIANPSLSQYNILMSVFDLLRKTNKCPLSGSSPSSLRTMPTRPLKDFRMSIGVAQSEIFVLDGMLSMRRGR